MGDNGNMATTLTTTIQSGQTLQQALELASSGYPTTNPTRTGYLFTGWNTSADGTGTTINPTDILTANTTVYAQWVVYKPTNTITVSGEGYTVRAVAQQAVASALSLPVTYITNAQTQESGVVNISSGATGGSVGASGGVTSIVSATVTPTSDASFNYEVAF